MSTMHGADVAQLRALAVQLERTADQLDASRVAVGNAIRTGAWFGPAATSFQHQWNSEHSSAVASATWLLRQNANRLRSNADEQERASSAADVLGVSVAVGPISQQVLGVSAGTAIFGATFLHTRLAITRAMLDALVQFVLRMLRHKAANPGVSGSQDYSTTRAVEVAKSEVGSTRQTGYNEPGECIKSVQRWIGAAGGRFGGGGVVSGYVNSGATAVTDGTYRVGDVIQYTSLASPDAFVHGVHTVMVTAVHPDGSLDIVQSNVPEGSGLVSEAQHWRPSPPKGFEARTWRFAREVDE